MQSTDISLYNNINAIIGIDNNFFKVATKLKNNRVFLNAIIINELSSLTELVSDLPLWLSFGCNAHGVPHILHTPLNGYLYIYDSNNNWLIRFIVSETNYIYSNLDRSLSPPTKCFAQTESRRHESDCYLYLFTARCRHRT